MIAHALPAVPVAAPSATMQCRSDLKIRPSQVLEALQARLPNTPMKKAQRTPIPGITAITLRNGRQVYAANGGNYLIIGVIYNLNTGKTLQHKLQGKDGVNPSKKEVLP